MNSINIGKISQSKPVLLQVNLAKEIDHITPRVKQKLRAFVA
jgi:hypothetical protein